MRGGGGRDKYKWVVEEKKLAAARSSWGREAGRLKRLAGILGEDLVDHRGLGRSPRNRERIPVRVAATG